MFANSIYLLIQKSILGSRYTFSIKACLQEVQHTILHYVTMCNRWNSSVKHICGKLVSFSEKSNLWTFEVLHTNLVIIRFHYFHLLSSYQCQINSVEVTRYGHEQSFKQLYCGDLPPWTESCECSKIKVQLLFRWRFNDAAYFSLEYYTGIQPNLAKHYRIVHLSELEHPIRLPEGMITNVILPKTSLIHILLMSDGRHQDDLCFNLVIYDGPSVECQLVSSWISSTYQISITLGNYTCEEARQIKFSKIIAPQISHIGQYVYNSSNANAYLNVMQFRNPRGVKGDIVRLSFEQIIFEGLKGLDCEYGGLLLSSPKQYILALHEEISTEMVYCDQFLPYFENPLSVLNATGVVYAYRHFAQVSVTISVLEISNTTSLTIFPMRSLLNTSTKSFLITAVHAILINDVLPQLKRKKLVFLTINDRILSTVLLSEAHGVIQNECWFFIWKVRRGIEEKLEITSNCGWMTPPIRIDVILRGYSQLTLKEKWVILPSLEGIGSIHVQFSYRTRKALVCLSVSHLDRSKYTELTIYNVTCSGIMTIYSLWHFNISSILTWRLHHLDLQVQWSVASTNCEIQYIHKTGEYLPADHHSSVHTIVYAWWVCGGGQNDDSVPPKLYDTPNRYFSWTEAKSFCLRHSTSLSTINSYEKLNIILNKLRNHLYYTHKVKHGLGEIFFIGAYISKVNVNS